MTDLHRVNEISKLIKKYRNNKSEWTKRVNATLKARLNMAKVARNVAAELRRNGLLNNNTGAPNNVLRANQRYQNALQLWIAAEKNTQKGHRNAFLISKRNLTKRLLGVNTYLTNNELEKHIENWEAKKPILVLFARALTGMGPIKQGNTSRGLNKNELAGILGPLFKK